MIAPIMYPDEPFISTDLIVAIRIVAFIAKRFLDYKIALKYIRDL